MNKLKVLMELRPAGEGFAGIPQETRLLFSALRADERIALCGLLNHHQNWAGDLDAASVSGGERLYERSRAVLSLADVHNSRWSRIADKVYQKLTQPMRLRFMRAFGRPLKVYGLDMSPFSDFVWRSYFSKSLAAPEFERITSADFAAIKPSWAAMQKLGRSFLLPPGAYMRMDTSAYDFYLSQTPFPARISRGTQLVVRFHDAIPIFYPHTIHNARWHQFTHYYPLRSNLKQGAILVCNSENSRREALAMFPEAEAQTHVIPCMVSDEFREDAPSRETLADIIRSGLEPDTEPKFSGTRTQERFYSQHIDPAKLRYIMMVSTIEPRKNHQRLIAAWNLIRTTVDPGLKLVIVGRPGWHVESVIASMAPFQARGMLFNVSRISAGDLRRLYAGAEAVVCPSIAEGFDLSGIEAMLSGAAVAASDIPVHREIYQDACEYFSPYSTAEAADAILRIIDSNKADNKRRLVERGAQIGEAYRRDRIGAMWGELFEELGSKRQTKARKGA